MEPVRKGLVVREPWIDLLLSGEKTWEMRGQRPSYRGWIGLIRKGSGLVSGIAHLIDVGYPLSPDQMIKTFEKHRIPERMIQGGEVAKWTTPWKLSDIRALREPVPYRHPNGAITLFSLAQDVSAKVSAQLREARADQPGAIVHRVPPLSASASVEAPWSPPGNARSRAGQAVLLGETVVTAGNLNNGHIYLRPFLHRFPIDLVGGRDQHPQVMSHVEADGMPPTSTDICPRHRFFRDRSWTRAFLTYSDAEPGDVVQVHELAPYRYKVSIGRMGRA
ncbi:ASCH domain-containing protein [Amaricoccus solimangrovi]|uniref:ASCH domain-containing protein n=1 Tax=Amaricoccus solimangrovi TaxID=2589815 RepID=A0A501WGH8_9RHOB|nr:ASCH domain-containing protein [Amaricoccus solimangrovi]TPE47164.1 ASCH domain-containing protein [Amaricoccus solimangrovi]